MSFTLDLQPSPQAQLPLTDKQECSCGHSGFQGIWAVTHVATREKSAAWDAVCWHVETDVPKLNSRTGTRLPRQVFWKSSLSPNTRYWSRREESTLCHYKWQAWWSHLVISRGPHHKWFSSFSDNSWGGSLCSEHLICPSSPTQILCVLSVVHSLYSIKAYVVLSHEKYYWGEGSLKFWCINKSWHSLVSNCLYLAGKHTNKKSLSVFYNGILAHLNHLFDFFFPVVTSPSWKIPVVSI